MADVTLTLPGWSFWVALVCAPWLAVACVAYAEERSSAYFSGLHTAIAGLCATAWTLALAATGVLRWLTT